MEYSNSTRAVTIAFLVFLVGCGGGGSGNDDNSGPRGPIAVGAAWTWVGGSDGADGPSFGLYGTLGVPSRLNGPGGRLGAASWTDSAGNLWLFGGLGFGSGNTTEGMLNDLWKYDTATGQWAWISGDVAVNGVGIYGTMGVSSTSNIPRARRDAVSWIDASGNLWLFGGNNSLPIRGVSYAAGAANIYPNDFTVFNDLWKFDPMSRSWTWVSGANTAFQAGVYGARGVASATNVPGARYAASGWVDSSGNLWLFGGTAGGTRGTFNDLWKFNTNAGTWTWVGGANVACTLASSCLGNYGQRGVPSANNLPPPRFDAAFQRDASGKFWIFGGVGASPGISQFPYFFNDAWQFDPGTEMWTWLSGSNNPLAVAQPVYGTKGVADVGNVPSGIAASASWVDSSGNFWLFGGMALTSTGIMTTLNVLWKYNPSDGKWAWMGGSEVGDPSPSYGIQGVPSIDNMPGARVCPVARIDASGNLWLFGGYGPGSERNNNYAFIDQNDLWKFKP